LLSCNTSNVILTDMSTKELKRMMLDRIKDIPDDAPASMVQHLLDAIEELAKGEVVTLQRMARFMKNIEEDKALLQRLAE
jgi:nucleoid DNA-binding protein